MKRQIDYNKIRDFQSIVVDVSKTCKYHNLKKPVIEFIGSEKIHGTNAACCYSIPDGLWFQSRENILTTEQDNGACYFNGMKHEQAWMDIIFELANIYHIDLKKNIISVYYEWCGGKIQKKSALSGLDKRAIIFQHFKVSPLERDTSILESSNQPAMWYKTYNIDCKEANIYNIMNFKTYKKVIDFDKVELFKNDLQEQVDILEHNSPVGNYFGINDNIAEGIVWTGYFRNNLMKFKVKGTKHTNSKVCVIKKVDEVKEQAKITLAERVVTPGRCEQGWQYIFGIENEKCEPSKNKMGDFLRWIHKDISLECMQDYIDLDVEPRECNGRISQVAKLWFEDELEKYAFGV